MNGDGKPRRLVLQPITFPEACCFVRDHHRHHQSPQGWKFGIAVNNGEKIVGVIMVGRPVTRHADDGVTLEVTRNCTDGTKNAASKLYGAAWRAAKAMGYQRLITYTLDTESGVTLSASGWSLVAKIKGKPWNNNTRVRKDNHPLCDKRKWEVITTPSRRLVLECKYKTPTTISLDFSKAVG